MSRVSSDGEVAAATSSAMDTEAPPAEAAAPPRFRSAADYDNEPSLRAALSAPPWRENPTPNPVTVTPCVFDSNLASVCCDWQSAKLDLSSSHPQNMEEEVKRLMELKEYAILDTEHEGKFERITALASRIFDVPICLVSLVDIGRQWFKSNRGLGEARETSREVSFCAHAILSTQDVFIVPDTYEDPRFKENGLVTGPPFIRFYAGVPLVSPAGYKLGTFCIIDGKPRPNGLGLNEKQNLRELTEMVMDTMVHRKQEMERLVDEKTRLIACAAHDLLSPLTGIQLNLGLLMDDDKLQEKLDDNQKELVDASMQCSDVITRICVQAIESFRGDLTRNDGSNLSEEKTEQGLVNVDQLVDNIERVIGTYPKKVPFFVEKDESVPPAIISDDLKLFRSIVNYLTNACKHTKTGSIRLRIHVRRAADSATQMELDLLPGALISPKTDSFIMEVHDTGPGIELEKYTALFTPLMNRSRSREMENSGLGLYSVATEITSLGGEFGVFPREDLAASHADHDGLDASTSDITGCVFWLSVPLVLPSNSPTASSSLLDGKKTSPTDDSKLMPAPSIKRSYDEGTDDSDAHLAKKSDLKASLTKKTDDSSGAGVGATLQSDEAIQHEPSKRAKRALIIDDSLTIRKGLARGFSRLGFEVDEAENGLQGFKKLKASLYDIVLLDFLMPVMDGPEVATKFRAWEKAHRPDFHQYIVGISAHANGKDAEVGIKAGMTRFMGKPVPLKSLKDLAQCKPVQEAGVLLDLKFKQSRDALEAACHDAEIRSDEGSSKSHDVARSDRTASSVSSHSTSFAKYSALIAMPDEPSLHSLQRILHNYGWRTVVVSNGEDALRLLKLRNWDTVFVDNDLPVFSGSNCLIRFRDWEKRSRATHQKNVFIMSDSYTPSTLPSGFDGALAKPLDPRKVLNVLETATNGSFKVKVVHSHSRAGSFTHN